MRLKSALWLPVCAALCLRAAVPDQKHLRMSFEANRGQAPASASYVARGAGYTLLLSRKGGDLALPGGSLRLRVEGADPHSTLEPMDALPGKVNYLRGTDSRKWLTDVPTWSRVRQSDILPGIDIVYYGNGRQLEYDFVLAPGADPNRIALRFDGVSRMNVDQQGDLVLKVGNDTVKQAAPMAYQIIDGKRRSVASSYVVADARVKFAVGEYDRSRHLVIDPTLIYSTYVGGAQDEGATAVAVDSSGAVYLAGFTTSTAFPGVQNGYQNTNRGSGGGGLLERTGDAFVLKLNATGTAVTYATYLGGTGNDIAWGIAVDSSGSAYVGGNTVSANFPTTANAFRTSYSGAGGSLGMVAGDGFIAKLNPAGNQLVYSSYIGGSGDDRVWGIALDRSNNAYITGHTLSSNFPVTTSAFQQRFGGSRLDPSRSLPWGDAFIAKVSADGGTLTYSSYLGGSSDELAKGIAVDSTGAAYVSGNTISDNFPTTAGVLQSRRKTPTDGDRGDVFVTKVSPDGSTLSYSTYLGGSIEEVGWALALDSANNVYVGGLTYSPDFPVTAGPLQTTISGDHMKPFVSKLNATGSALVYSTTFGGSSNDMVLGIALDAAGVAHLTGFTQSSNFPTTTDAYQRNYRGSGGSNNLLPAGDAFYARLSPTGSALTYSTLVGGTADDLPFGIALGTDGSAYIAGVTVSTNFPTTSGVLQSAFGGAAGSFPRGDVFVSKIGEPVLAPAPSSIVAVGATTGLNGAAGTALANPLVVEVRDASGTLLPNIAVTFAGTNATVTPTTANTDAAGRASTRVTLGSTAGTAVVTATIAGLPSVRYEITIQSATPGIRVTGVANAASFQPRIAPGSLISIFGANFSTAIAQAGETPLPTSLGGVTVRVNNTPIPLVYIQGDQINAQLPQSVPGGAANVTVTNSLGTSVAFPFEVVPAAPGIFQFGQSRAVVQNPDFSVNTTDNPVAPLGYVTVYLTGIGAVDNAVPTGAATPTSPLSSATAASSVKIGGVAATAVFLGLTPNFVGLAQANVQVPQLAPGDYPLIITVGGVDSNGPVITVR